MLEPEAASDGVDALEIHPQAGDAILAQGCDGEVQEIGV